MAYPITTLPPRPYGDPVSYGFRAPGDWSGPWIAQVRRWRDRGSPLLGEFTVTASYDAIEDETTVWMSLDVTESEKIPPGNWPGDVQQVDGVTWFPFVMPVIGDVSHVEVSP